MSTTAYWIGGVARSNSEDNDKSKYDGSHEDDIDDAQAFSFVDHLILARTKLNSISPISAKGGGEVGHSQGDGVTLRRRGNRLGETHRLPSAISLPHWDHGDDRTRPVDVSR